MHFRKERGWSGRTYWVQMTQQEIEARRKFGLVVSVLVTMPIMAVVMCVCAGLIR